jgi:pilus assembly protein Flp/PilA
MIERIVNRFRTETGATAVEYGLFVALIAAVIVGVVLVLGGQVQEALQGVSDAIATVQ